jgi:D-proline reductase (dithiol) PrdB
MVRVADLPEASQERLLELDCPLFETKPWAGGRPLATRRVAIISSAGLKRRGDPPFAAGAADHRAIPSDTPAGDIVMSHVSLGFDRTGFQQHLNVIFPLDHMRELAAEGVIGALAANHYSYMGATDPRHMEADARELASAMKREGVDAVLLVPV